MDSKEKALDLAAKKNAAEVLMIVLREEQRQDPEHSHVLYKLTLEDAPVFLETIDRSRSSAQEACVTAVDVRSRLAIVRNGDTCEIAKNQKN